MLARVARNRSLRALAVRNFRIYYAGETVSVVGGWIHAVAQNLLVLQLTHSGAALGLTVALQNLPVLLLGAWGGVVADRVDNRRLLVTTAALGVAQAVALGIMTSTGAVTAGWVYAFALVLGVIVAFQFPAASAFVYELVDERDLPSAIGLTSVTMSIGRMAGSALCALLVLASGIAACFYVDAVSYLFVVVALLSIDRSKIAPRRTAAHERVSLRAGLRYVWHRPELRLTLAVVTVVGMLAYNFNVVVPAMVGFEFHSGLSTIAWVLAIGGVGSLAGGFVAASFRRSTVRVLGVAGIAFGGFMLASALMPDVTTFAALWLPVGVASALFMAVGQMVLQHGADPEHQGRVMSLYHIAWMGTTPFGALLVGLSIEASSARVGVALGGVATLGAGLAAVAWVVLHRHSPAGASPVDHSKVEPTAR